MVYLEMDGLSRKAVPSMRRRWFGLGVACSFALFFGFGYMYGFYVSHIYTATTTNRRRFLWYGCETDEEGRHGVSKWHLK